MIKSLKKKIKKDKKQKQNKKNYLKIIWTDYYYYY